MDTLTVSNLIGDDIRRWAKYAPDNPAFIAKGQRPLSYDGLCAAMDHIQRSLAEAGIRRGNRIALLHPGGAEMATLLFGVMDGTVAAPIDPTSTVEEVIRQCRMRSAQAVIVDETLRERGLEAANALDLPVLEAVRADAATAGKIALRQITDGTRRPNRADQADDLAAVLTSSGTTGEAHVVPLRHRNVIARSTTTAGLLGLTPDDRGLNMNKLFLGGGVQNLHVCLLTGGSVILMPSFDPDAFFDYLAALEPTWYVGSFTVNKAIYEAALKRPQPIDIGCLRMVRTSSGPIDGDVADNLERLLGVPVIEAFASTEAGRMAGNPQPPGLRKRGTVGPPIGCEMVLLDESGNPVETGRRGEVTVRGPGVVDGYEDNPAANAAAFVDGWYRTGDVGFLDGDGYLTLTGRIKEMINRGGEKISPAEVDDALTAHPDIADAAAFALPHPTLGEIVGAAVVPMPGKAPTKQILTRFLSSRLAGFKIPRAIFVVEAIPRGPTGKVLRKRLSEQFAAPR